MHLPPSVHHVLYDRSMVLPHESRRYRTGIKLDPPLPVLGKGKVQLSKVVLS